VVGGSGGGGGLHHPVVRLALFHYGLNIIWAPVFFGTKRLRAGHVLNVGIVSTLLATVVSFYRIDVVSGLLLVPYLVWVSFATRLSAEVCKLNPTKRGYNNAMFEADLFQLQKKAGKYVGL